MTSYYSLSDLHRYQDELRLAAAEDRLATRLRRARRRAGATSTPVEQPCHAD